MKNKLLFSICLSVIILLLTSANAFASVLSDGAYLVGRQTSYVNPDTGVAVDGGTNIALGDSMCASIVDENLLIEQSNGKIYVTIGLGLMSNVQNVRIQVQDQNGSYHDVTITLTGSCQRNGDACNHYRFEVPSLDSKISPIIYVTPMGRDVQFFVIPDIGSATAGTGNFLSEMVKSTYSKTTTTQASQTTTQIETTTVQETTQNYTTQTATTITEESSTVVNECVSVEENSNTEDNSNGSIIGWIIGAVVFLIVIGICIWYFCFYKKRK